MTQTHALIACFIFIMIIFIVIVGYIKVLDDRITALTKQLNAFTEGIKPLPANDGPWFPDSGKSSQPGFWVAQPNQSDLPPPPIFGFPPVDLSQHKAQGQTSPVDNLPLRGTAK